MRDHHALDHRVLVGTDTGLEPRDRLLQPVLEQLLHDLRRGLLQLVLGLLGDDRHDVAGREESLGRGCFGTAHHGPRLRAEEAAPSTVGLGHVFRVGAVLRLELADVPLEVIPDIGVEVGRAPGVGIPGQAQCGSVVDHFDRSPPMTRPAKSTGISAIWS